MNELGINAIREGKKNEDMPYLKKKGGRIDGIGRSHFTLHTQCDKCGTTSSVARIHGD